MATLLDLLLHCCPREFHETYGRDIVELFDTRRSRLHGSRRAMFGLCLTGEKIERFPFKGQRSGGHVRSWLPEVAYTGIRATNTIPDGVRRILHGTLNPAGLLPQGLGLRDWDSGTRDSGTGTQGLVTQGLGLRDP